ncbi:MAG: hypothetical protein MK089_12265, partial [Phycisphaerales bacterium]|nr:hypothetical protein [Phycisphaerales bacterium]
AGGGRGAAQVMLEPAPASAILNTTLEALPQMGWESLAHTTSPIRGAKSGKRKKGAGNLEFLALLKPLLEG